MKTIAQELGITEFPFEIKDKNGKEIYYEYSNGFWVKREFDSNGKEIYYENSDGYWSKREFDSKGRETSYEDSKGCWYKAEYDSKGNEIYFEDSDGTIRDNRPKSSCEGKIVEVDGKKYQLKEVK